MRITAHIDGQAQLLNANDFIYISKGALLCFAREIEDAIHLAEVQSGSYVGEDDIERLDDIYGRD